MTHDTYHHAADDVICVLGEDGVWWVPLDVGGEGYPCQKTHGVVEPVPPRVNTKEENIAFRKEWDARVDAGKVRDE